VRVSSFRQRKAGRPRPAYPPVPIIAAIDVPNHMPERRSSRVAHACRCPAPVHIEPHVVINSIPAQAGGDKYSAIGRAQLESLGRRFGLSDALVARMTTIAQVLPFRVNEYVLSQLIDWDNIPADPIFQLVFPQPGMIEEADEAIIRDLTTQGRVGERDRFIRLLRKRLNPHPGGQLTLNIPAVDMHPLRGVQHKYAQTVLYFPSNGQTCHAYCTYCFRWAQFVGDRDLRFAASDSEELADYLVNHPEVSDVLITGGDPMIMKTRTLRRHIEPLLGVESLRTVRIGTKALAYWPQRFVDDDDSDDLLRLLDEIADTGRLVAVMAHFSHPREIQTDLTLNAIQRLRAAGAQVYCQAPLVAHVNDSAEVLAELWRAELAAGCVPYYLFVERDTGPSEYFKVPLWRTSELFNRAYRTLPGLARTVRGPSMSTTPGKIVIDDAGRPGDEKVFQLRFVQARNASLVRRPFTARYAESASWANELQLGDDVPADIREAFGTV
jgi:KamA family protein